MSTPEPAGAATARPRWPNRRDFFRVRARLPLGVRPVRPGEEDAPLMAAPEPPAFRPRDPVLAAWLERIERKLDLLLARTDPAASRPGLAACDVDVSGGGLRFDAGAALDPGSRHWLEIELPAPRFRRIRALATAVRRDGEETAFAFQRIDEVDRDALVAFVLDAERARRRTAPATT